MLASDVAPVQPVRAVPDRQVPDRQEVRRASAEVDDARERVGRGSATALRRSGPGATETGGDASGTPDSGVEDSAADTRSAPAPIGQPSAAFVAQRLHQETIGSGLHIEPWDQAMSAYRQVLAGPPAGGLVKSVVV